MSLFPSSSPTSPTSPTSPFMLSSLVSFVVCVFCLLSSSSMAQNNCKWTVGGQELDLSAMNTQYLNGVSGVSFYYLTPCRNDMSCTISGQYYMVVEAESNMCTKWLAKFDQATDTPLCSSAKGGTFTFEYTGDTTTACPNGVRTDIRYVCTATGAEINPLIVVKSEACEIILEERTSLACLDVDCPSGGGGGGGSGVNTDDAGMSTGAFILIFGFIAVFLYCAIGCAISKTRTNKDVSLVSVKTHMPHSGFWCSLLPQLTWAGCCATKDWIRSKVGGEGSGKSRLASEADDFGDAEEGYDE